MSTTIVSIEGNIATLTLAHGKVNSINEKLVDDFNKSLDQLESDANVDALILTGREKFFSFGFDVPELLSLSREDLTRFLTKHTALLLRLFMFDKPIVAAINGHATAGGCMLITPCDYRVVAEGRSRIGLNEIDLGVAVFGGSAEMLRYCVGDRNAELILNDGTLFTVEQAHELGLVDQVVSSDDLIPITTAKAKVLGAKPKAAYRAIKQLTRGPLASIIAEGEQQALDAFIETWYSGEAQEILRTLAIRK
ncbi:MAG: enoyl-CoA hydratase/isomerase family protein [candidate division Zixibacteria bacterium]|nr:enoyl-CoA hydratase/isomerase family protein [candidate division Zixibacteria bacterium]MDH3938418.1 enoyl-CoA hydratase/isomerase family protein [candidate division Zixibacteria bacterium]MDH4035590.1 enoyl-CoA hydratase/isomerase family protein [candidate division Zixibacteria bacterium]